MQPIPIFRSHWAAAQASGDTLGVVDSVSETQHGSHAPLWVWVRDRDVKGIWAEENVKARCALDLRVRETNLVIGLFLRGNNGSSRFLSYGALGPRLMLQPTCSFWEMVTSCSNDTGFYVWPDILFILKFKLGNRSIKLFSWSNDKYNLASYTSNFRH